MIADTLKNIALYRGLSRNMDTAIDFLLKTDLNALPDGRHEVDGDKVFVNVMAVSFRAQNRFEAHRRYIDIQIALGEGESIEWLPYERVTRWEEYAADRDYQGGQSDVPGMAYTLRPMDFAVYFPRDAHKPGLGEGTGRKAVVKVRVD